MSVPTNQELNKIVQDNDLQYILLFNNDGDLIESNKFKFDTNYAAMSGTITSMCNQIIKDLQYGDMNKVIIHASNGFILITKISNNHYIAALTKDESKLGILMKTMDSIKNK
ncbi:roadblock/LC7 domain-containing protein [Flavobacterium sp. XS1P32]|uniref:roadblock/LC7 domain-containing protein n=1 Tax=unclassified Flavobacterium TaxID=196869 RepID=UPI003AAA89AD